jgi:hypothetical protein
MLSKATLVLIASGVTGSGIVAHTHFGGEPEPAASTVEVAAPSDALLASTDLTTGLSNESFQQAYLQTGMAAQRRPFACFTRVTR